MTLPAIGLWIAAALLALLAQPPQPDRKPTFRSATALVEVDIIARDRDGRFVSGLTAADFEIFEDDRRQTIEHFYLVTERPRAVVETATAGTPVRAPDVASPLPPPRLIRTR